MIIPVSTIDYESAPGAHIHYELQVLDVEPDDNGTRPALKTWRSVVARVPEQRYWMTVTQVQLDQWWVPK